MRHRPMPFGAFFLAVVLAAFSLPAFAQPMCFARDEFISGIFEAHGEVVTARALLDGGAGVLELFRNAESGTWTLVVVTPEGTVCPAASGVDWERVAPAPPARSS